MGLQHGDALIHGAGGNQDLGNKHLRVAEFFTDGLHAPEQTVLQNLMGRDPVTQGLLHQLFDQLGLAGLKLQRDFLKNHVSSSCCLFLLFIV